MLHILHTEEKFIRLVVLNLLQKRKEKTLALTSDIKNKYNITPGIIQDNPLTPKRTQVSPFTEISILFQEVIIKKIFYERRAHESVDKNSLS